MRLSNLSVSLLHKTLFHDFSYTFTLKSRIGIIGRNGSGKSTLLKLIKDSLNYDVAFVPQIIQEFENLSGAEKFNKKLSKELGKRPSILLLDEPTNHLDVANKRSLIKMINRFPGVVIVVTHDLDLLDSCVDVIWHLEHGKVNLFQGKYSDYMANLRSQKEAIQSEKKFVKSQIESLNKKLQKDQERSAKSAAMGKKKVQNKRWLKAVGDLKAMKSETSAGKKLNHLNSNLERLRTQESEIFIPKVVIPKFNILGRKTNSSILIEDGAVGYSPDRFVLENINISTKEKLAIVGRNGSGKTTFLKALVKDPKVYTKGKWIVQKEIGYVDQHYSILDPQLTVFQTIKQTAYSMHDTEIRRLLNDFLFIKTEEIEAQVKYLSGGELARLCLAKVSINPPELLILDEITNNIDLETKQQIAEILKRYSWQFVIVSHDESFLNDIGVTQSYEIS